MNQSDRSRSGRRRIAQPYKADAILVAILQTEIAQLVSKFPVGIMPPHNAAPHMIVPTAAKQPLQMCVNVSEIHRLVVLVLAADLVDPREQVAELCVVELNTIVEINRDPLVR